jgi:hypothetical protein
VPNGFTADSLSLFSKLHLLADFSPFLIMHFAKELSRAKGSINQTNNPSKIH